MWLNKLSHELRHTTPGLGRNCVLSLEGGKGFDTRLPFLLWFLTEYMEMLVSSWVEGMSKSPSIVLSLKWECSSVWLEHLPFKQRVESSNLSAPIDILRSSPMVGQRALNSLMVGSIPLSVALEHWRSLEFSLPCHGRDRRFKSFMLRLCDHRLIGRIEDFQSSNLSSSLSGRFCASLAQLVEQLPCKQLVEGSMPSGGLRVRSLIGRATGCDPARLRFDSSRILQMGE